MHSLNVGAGFPQASHRRSPPSLNHTRGAAAYSSGRQRPNSAPHARQRHPAPSLPPPTPPPPPPPPPAGRRRRLQRAARPDGGCDVCRRQSLVHMDHAQAKVQASWQGKKAGGWMAGVVCAAGALNQCGGGGGGGGAAAPGCLFVPSRLPTPALPHQCGRASPAHPASAPTPAPIPPNCSLTLLPGPRPHLLLDNPSLFLFDFQPHAPRVPGTVSARGAAVMGIWSQSQAGATLRSVRAPRVGGSEAKREAHGAGAGAGADSE